MKYTSWDKRNHYGIGTFSSCSYAFKESMAWAPMINEAGCNATVLAACGKDILEDCQKSGFSDSDGANSKYEKSWVGCREECLTSQWHKWCEDQQCSGSKHADQCKNVTETVQRPYTVKHMPAGNAWEAGELCRDVGFLCAGVDGDIETAGKLSVAGLVFAGLGLACLIAHTMRQNFQKVLLTSMGFWLLAWVLLLASWASFASIIGKDAECKVEAESRKGAVIASGKFGDIINGSGSYTYGVVCGSWLLASVPITLIGLRIKDLRNPKPEESQQPAESKVAEEAQQTQTADVNAQEDVAADVAEVNV